MSRTEASARAVPRTPERGALGSSPLPLGLALAAILFAALLVDRVFGVTTFVIGVPGGMAGRLGSDAGAVLVADLVAVVTVLAVLVVLGALEHVWRPRRRGGTFTLVLVAALIGLQLGAFAATSATGVALPVDLYLARALLLAGTTIAALRMLSALSVHRHAVQELRSATAAADSLADSGRAALGDLREDVAGRVREVLREALDALEGGAAAGSATRLRSLADEVLRPLSHRLASEVTPTASRRTVVAAEGWGSTFETLLRAPVIPARVLASMAAGFVFLRSLVTDQDRVRDLSSAIPADAGSVGFGLSVDAGPLLLVLGELALVFLAVGWTAGRLADLVERGRSGWRSAYAWTLASLGIVGVSALTVVTPMLVARLAGFGEATGDGRPPLLVLAASFLPLMVVTLGVSLFAAVGTERAALEADLARQRAETARTAARVQAVLAHERRRLARSLHADVQSTVNAAGLMLDRADREGGLTSELVDDVAERIAGSVERFLGGGSSALPVIERLAEVRALWAGVCSVVLELDEGAGARIDADTVTRDAIVDLVTEACANAVVHGAADSVLVRVHVEGDEVVLAVADDGTRRPGAAAGHDGGEGEVARRVPGGLGTEVLRMSCTEFSLDIGEQGSRLLARVPLG